MLVTDALDTVLTEPIAQQRRALQGFTRNDFPQRKMFFEKIPAGDGAGRPS